MVDVSVSAGSPVVGEAAGDCWTCWVSAVSVDATMEATASEGAPVETAPFGRLQALAKETAKIVKTIAIVLFIYKPPLVFRLLHYHVNHNLLNQECKYP
jgi:hypothetical protein